MWSGGGGGAGSRILALSLSSYVPGAGHFTVLSSVMKGGEEQSFPQWVFDQKNL